MYLNKVFLVTGGTGFLGSAFVDKLINYNIKTYIITRKNIVSNNPNIIYIKTNLTEISTIPEDVDIIVNCAGVIDKEEEMDLINVNVVEKLCKICINNNIKFLHISSVGVYGCQIDTIINENYICNPKNKYEISKYSAEKIIESYTKKGLKSYILQPSIIFGKCRDNVNDSFLNFLRIIQNRKYFYINSGSGIYNLVHINEVVNAIFFLTGLNSNFGEKYIISENISFKDFVTVAKSELFIKSKTYSIPNVFIYFIIGISFILKYFFNFDSKLTYSRFKTFKLKRYFLSDKLFYQIGFKTEHTIEEYIKFTIHNFKQEGLL
jgi:nucleoside-diphosphate-sugar epimerase